MFNVFLFFLLIDFKFFDRSIMGEMEFKPQIKNIIKDVITIRISLKQLNSFRYLFIVFYQTYLWFGPITIDSPINFQLCYM